MIQEDASMTVQMSHEDRPYPTENKRAEKPGLTAHVYIHGGITPQQDLSQINNNNKKLAPRNRDLAGPRTPVVLNKDQVPPAVSQIRHRVQYQQPLGPRYAGS